VAFPEREPSRHVKSWGRHRNLHFIEDPWPIALRDRRLRRPRYPDWTARTGKKYANPREFAQSRGRLLEPLHNMVRSNHLDLKSQIAIS
jgi:hypothetical protein